MRWIYVSPNQFKIIVVFLKKSKQEHTARNTSPSAAIGLSLDSFHSCILYKNGVGVLQKLSTIGVKMRFGHKHWIHMNLSVELLRTHNSLCRKSTWTHRVSNESITTFTGFIWRDLRMSKQVTSSDIRESLYANVTAPGVGQHYALFRGSVPSTSMSIKLIFLPWHIQNPERVRFRPWRQM